MVLNLYGIEEYILLLSVIKIVKNTVATANIIKIGIVWSFVEDDYVNKILFLRCAGYHFIHTS